MSRKGDSSWTDLLVDRSASPPPMAEARFQKWMEGRRIFVSSTLNEEMLPARQAVRQYLTKYNADAVMWESITPADARAQDAYLDGVARSELFLLLTGSRYGTTDSTGYSPTHKEGNRAAELGLTRLLFEKADVKASDRDGRLNDWIGSLYSELSGARYTSEVDLVSVLDSRLREIASAQETYWVKLGNLVFPASITRQSSGNQTTFTVSAELRDATLRRAINRLVRPGFGHGETSLTWSLETHTVRVAEITSRSVGVSVEEIRITCVASEDAGWRSYGFGGMTYVDHSGQSFGPREQAEVWLSSAVFGDQKRPANDHGVFRGRSGESGPTLPEVLAETSSKGWRAEGIVRLYLVDELDRIFGAYLAEMDVGPASARSIRVLLRLVLPEKQELESRGLVPLPL
jgi:hypothetical protein